MKSDSLIHDVSWAASLQVLEVFVCLLREDEQRDAFEETYRIMRAALEAYEERADRMLARLSPTKN